MIKQIRPAFYHNLRNSQYCALSTDPIHSDLENGDEVYFIDSGKIYIWNSATNSLVEKKTNSGGGSGSDLMVVKITEDTSAGVTTYTFSHTPAEVYAWVTANKPAIAIMNGVIGKVYFSPDSDVICAIPKYNAFLSGTVRSSDGLTAVGYENGTEWHIENFMSLFGADELVSASAQDGYAIIWDVRDGAPQYQPINKNYIFNGALSQLITGAMLAAAPEAALSTVFESTAPEFGTLVYIIEQIYESFVVGCRGVMVQGIIDQNNRDSWLVKNVTEDNSEIYITADASFTTFSNNSPSSVSMVTLTIVELKNNSQKPEKVAITAICKTINTTVV